MPLPKPRKGESHDDFMGRCMNDDAMQEEYPDQKQRYAVCETQWDDRSMKNTNENAIETRVLPAEDVELRVERDQDGNPTKITGYAARFNKDSVDFGGFIERIKPGAFTNTLKTSDVRALVNHDPNLLLGRTKSETLSLVENKRGLKFSVDLPDNTAARDAAESIKRRDMDGCSFSFRIVGEEWHEGKDGEPDVRTLLEVDPLYDVGPVTYPAYPDTSVAVRSFDAWKASRSQDDGAKPDSLFSPAGAVAIAECTREIVDDLVRVEQARREANDTAEDEAAEEEPAAEESEAPPTTEDPTEEIDIEAAAKERLAAADAATKATNRLIADLICNPKSVNDSN